MPTFASMKRLLFFLLMSNSLFAQVQMPAITKHQWDILKSTVASDGTLMGDVPSEIPVNRLNGIDYVSAMEG